MISISCLVPQWAPHWPPPVGTPVVTASGHPHGHLRKILTKESINKCGPSRATSSGHHSFLFQWAPNGHRLATSTRDLLHKKFIHEMFFVVPFIKNGVGFPCGSVMFMRCFLLGLSPRVAIGVSATSCGHPMATTSGHSMVTSTGDLLKIFLHEMFVVFPLMVTCVDFPSGNVLFLFCFSVGSFPEGCHRGVHRWWPWDASEG